MDMVSKLERTILKWLKDVPHLPLVVRKWLGDNVWWMTAIGTVLSGIAVLVLIIALFGSISTLGAPFVAYYSSATFVVWAIVTTAVSLVFVLLQCILLGMAVTPLREKQKKGWVLLFTVWLLGIVSVVVNAILTLNALTFIMNIIFGAIWAAIAAYFLFEIHGQYAHVERSKGVKEKKA